MDDRQGGRMGKIYIKRLTVFGNHGVSDNERARPQRLILDITITCDTSLAMVNDNLNATVNYATIKKMVTATVEHHSFKLLEALAGNIAGQILEHEKISSVKVRIEKPDIWENAIPAISVKLKKNNRAPT